MRFRWWQSDIDCAKRWENCTLRLHFMRNWKDTVTVCRYSIAHSTRKFMRIFYSFWFFSIHSNHRLMRLCLHFPSIEDCVAIKSKVSFFFFHASELETKVFSSISMMTTITTKKSNEIDWRPTDQRSVINFNLFRNECDSTHNMSQRTYNSINKIKHKVDAIVNLLTSAR